MSFVKAKLKNAKDALGKKDYTAARDAAIQVLEYEPDNYNAKVFLGLSLLELGEREKSEQVYRSAIDLKPDQTLAWQGISKNYERTEEWNKLAQTLEHLMEMYSKSNDPVRCAETWQKLMDLRRERGTRLEVVDGLLLVLPQSPIYAVLSTLPPPDPTNPSSTTTFITQTAIHDSLPILEEIIALLETHEEQTLKKEVERQRTRLGAAGPEQLRKDIGREIWGTSRLPSLYDELLNHPKTSDDLRRQTDSKLLRYKQRYLYCLPNTSEFASKKSTALKELQDLANGAVILRIPDELAWTIFLEGQDVESIAAYDHTHLQQFMGLFPTSPITSLFKGYFDYMGIALSEEEEEKEEGEEKPNDLADDDPFDVILDAFSLKPSSIIANRALADLYSNELDYENAIKVAGSGLELLGRAEDSTGQKLPSVRIAFKVVLATSLVHLFPPKHHVRALSLIDDVLSESPNNVTCLMGRAFILQESKKWEEASILFAKVDSLCPDDQNDGLRAREENAWCQCQLNDVETGLASLKGIVDILNDLEGREMDSARCLWRLGRTYWEIDVNKREEAYRYFIASLKADPAYAPAFTSLGIYYLECASPPDPTRASKCFQKAFELDPREADAARRLAIGFAEDREWDLVEVVARRTIEGEGGLDAGIKGAGAEAAVRYLPTNAWAWKAVGVVELNRRNYSPAIQAFQVALRADTEDELSWVRLGEAYSKAGRHVAAVKALDRAQQLRPDNWMCAYLIGDVKQQMGQYQDAITIFESILDTRPAEVGVLVSLGQAYLDLGRSELLEGFQARAEHSFVTCIRVGLRTIEESPGFRAVAWKTVADAVYSLSYRSTFHKEEAVNNVLAEVISLLPPESEHLSDILVLPSAQDETSSGLAALEIAAAAYSYRISLGSSESAPRSGSAFFDLGISLNSWTMRSPENSNNTKAKEKAITFLTQAIREDPGNNTYWAALGDAYFSSNAKTAQHAYIKALEIDSKAVATWTNLGLLYLYHNDVELANEALYRAQTLDPDHAIAWVGQALVAVSNEHFTEAMAMLEHAVGLTANVPEADLEFASRIFSQLRITGYDRNASHDTLLPVFFVLDRYCERRPDDATALHLFGLICESLGHLEAGAKLISRSIGILESLYENTEDPEVERRFMIASSNLARLRLSLRDYEGAVESFESALGLLPEDVSDPTIRILRAQTQFGSGLASFMQGDLEAALGLFEGALESAGDDLVVRGQVTVLLAQTMWAIRTDEFKETAKAQLLECITSDPENLAAINTLAGMGILTNDESLVDAALSEILALPMEQRHKLDPQRDVSYLLTQNYLGQGDIEKALSVAQSALVAEPSRPEVRNGLATLTLQKGEHHSALAVLSGSTSADSAYDLSTLPTSLSLQAIARCLDQDTDTGGTALREIQKAIMLSPSDIRHWQALAYVRSQGC